MNFNILIFIGIMIMTWVLVIISLSLTPFYTRKSVAFGVSIPESEFNNEFFKKLRYRYLLTSLICGIVLGAGSLLMQIWFDINISVMIQTGALFLYIAIDFVLYIVLYFRVRKFKENSNWEITKTVMATLTTQKDKKRPLNPLWFLSYVLIIVATAIIGFIRYPSLPDQIPMHYNMVGQVDRYAAKSIGNILLLPIIQIIMAAIFIGVYYSIMLAKRQSSGGDTEEGFRKNHSFRIITSKLMFLIGLATILLFSIIEFSILGLIGTGFSFIAPIVFLVVVFVVIIFLVIKVGQGGSRIGGNKSSKTAVDNKCAADDDNHWILGGIYNNKDDPSIFVEKRFGLGFTINVGNPVGRIILIVTFALICGLMALPLILH